MIGLATQPAKASPAAESSPAASAVYWLPVASPRYEGMKVKLTFIPALPAKMPALPAKMPACVARGRPGHAARGRALGGDLEDSVRRNRHAPARAAFLRNGRRT